MSMILIPQYRTARKTAAPPWTPAELFASSEEGFWLDPSDLSTLWQDTAGTTPAAVGDPVGRVDDKSGNGHNAIQGTSGKRPILRQDGDGAYYLEFDGTDDTLSITVATAQPWTSIYGFQLIGGLTITDGNTSGERLALYMTGSVYTLFDGAAIDTKIAYHSAKEWLLIGFNGSSTYFGARNGLTGPLTFGATEAPTGIILGAAYNGTNCAQMRIYQAISVGRSITYAERILARSWVYGQRLLADYPSHLLVCDGNSLTSGYGAATGYDYPEQLVAMLPAGVLKRNYGVGSQTTTNMSSDAATQVDNQLRAYTGAATLIAWEATNDIYFGADLASCQSLFQTYFNARIAAGWMDSGNKLVAMTIIARGNFDATQNTVAANFNTWLRANYAAYATHLVDLAADSRLQDFSDLTYYIGDQVHLNTAGYTVVADLVYAQVFA